MDCKAIFAFDFSMIKPAMCTLIDNEIDFYVWPAHVDDTTYVKLASAGIHITNRDLPEMKAKSMDESELICEHIRRSTDLADMIVNTLNNIMREHAIKPADVIIANEGFAFSAKGDAVLDLSGYKYILMLKLVEAGFVSFRTYSPISLKATAGCSKKGETGKDKMIQKLSEQDKHLHPVIKTLAEIPANLKKKTAYVDCVDDIADSFWCMRTTVAKENIECIFNVPDNVQDNKKQA